MCVTNTVLRRSQPISLQQQQQQQQAQDGVPSGLTQRLMGTFQLTAAAAKPQPAAFQAAAYNVLSAPVACSTAHVDKPRPKRRRKPQKPGKTAKMNDRHFVVHNYHDHSNDSEDTMGDHEQEHDEHSRRKGGVSVAFPLKLHAILDQVERDGLGHVISWQGHGRCFVIHQPKEFVNSVMPKYFRQSKLTSFQRQLNLYGFCRLTRGADAGGYYHELFLRGKQFLCKQMIRTKVKGTKFKAASSPEQEPDFYSMPPVVFTPTHSTHASPQVQPQVYVSDHSHSDYQETESMAPLAAPAPLSDLFSMFTSAQQQSFDPYPAQQQQQQFMPQMQQAAPAPLPFNANPAEQVMDEAVNELFLDSSTNNLATEMNDLDDFVRDWEPNNNISQSLDNDLALGFMLDKLLED